jgi:uncharacterized membrane protein
LIDRLSNETVAMGLVQAAKQAKRASLPRLPPAREKTWRSVAKAFSWRATGGLDTFILAWLFTRDAKIAASISGAEILTKLVLYYLHERVWARVRFGLSKD